MKAQFKMPDGEIKTADMPVFKTPYNHNTEFESERTATFCNELSLTKQEFKEETDINTIIERALKSGEPPPMALPEHFLDLTGRTTYFDMATKVADANKAFYELPAKLRADYLNDPTRWADAVVQAVDRGDRQTLAELGIDVPAEKPQTPEEGTPPSPATPGAATPPKAPEAPKGAPAAAQAAAKSDPSP